MMRPAPGLRLASLLVIALASLAGCTKPAPHDHADDHPVGHDHHAQGHGHSGESVVRITHWTDHFELFVEQGAARPGEPVELLAHLTVLDGFRPLAQGAVRFDLEGPSKVVAKASAPVRPGIYQLEFTPPAAGLYRGRLTIDGPPGDVIDGIAIGVATVVADTAPHPAPTPPAAAAHGEHEHEGHDHGHGEPEHAGLQEGEDHAHAEHARRSTAAEHEDGRYITLRKEQQWGVPFATAWTREGTVVASIEVPGTVTTPPAGSAEIGAPVAGRLVTPTVGFPRPGDAVHEGQVLAMLAPAPASPEASAHAGLAVSEAKARLAGARAAVERGERLIKDQAISQRELDDARRELGVAEEALRAAESARQLFAGARGGPGAGAWKLTAPIDGTLTEVAATPGASVGPGTILFRIVDTRELWLRARVPEQDAARLRADRDAAYQIAGLDGFLPISLTGDAPAASVVTIGRTVNPASRTVDVIYSLRDPDPRLRVGGLVRMNLPAGDEFRGVLIPRGALINDDGREVVYVQADGEHFEERSVRTGPRHGDLVGILQGLASRERVVVLGAQVVRMAARASSTEAHGHIH